LPRRILEAVVVMPAVAVTLAVEAVMPAADTRQWAILAEAPARILRAGLITVARALITPAAP